LTEPGPRETPGRSDATGPRLPIERPQRSLRWWALGSLVVGAALGAIRFGLVTLPGSGPTAAAGPAGEPVTGGAARQAEPVVITVATATARPVERRVRTVGTLHGFEEIDVSPLVDGRVARVAHDIGDIVEPGETLLEIDDADFLLSVQEVERSLELELASLGLSTVPDLSFDISRLPSVERAGLVERSAADTLERFRGLEARGAITKDEIQKAELALDTARLDRKQRLLDAEQALAAVRHREAVLETARKRLGDTRVVAPAIEVRTFRRPGEASVDEMAAAARTYTVAARYVTEGEVVRSMPAAILFRLVVEDVLKLKAAVPERHAASIAPGQEVDLAVESLPGVAVTGHVVRVHPTIDTASRTFDVEVQVPNAGHRLKPGAFAKASILLDRQSDAVTVPEESLVRFAGVTKLFVVVEGRAVAVPVEPGVRLDVTDEAGGVRRWIEIPAGVTAGAEVVTSGLAQLTDGAAVRVRAATTP
jgi:multidrug efflux pump subunit AcrA (membrane-fusion protein)